MYILYYVPFPIQLVTGVPHLTYMFKYQLECKCAILIDIYYM